MEKDKRTQYEIHIREVYNGFIVNVGCFPPIVAPDWKTLKEELDTFFTGKETEFVKGMLEYQNQRDMRWQVICTPPPIPEK